MTPAEFYESEHRNLLRASIDNLAAKIRNEHAADCSCRTDEAITEPINPEEQE